MEQTLNEALSKSIDIDWVRVRFENQSSLGLQSGAGILRIEIPFRDEKLPGEVIFAKTGGRRFSPTEIDFLMEVTEALALALQITFVRSHANHFFALFEANITARLNGCRRLRCAAIVAGARRALCCSCRLRLCPIHRLLRRTAAC